MLAKIGWMVIALLVGSAACAQSPEAGQPAASATSASAPVSAPGAVPMPAPGSVKPVGPAPLDASAPRIQPVPPGQPLADDYKIGPQDLIEVQVYGIENLKREVRVNSRGSITLPLIGVVAVAGLTGQEAEGLIAAKYEKDYLRDPHVTLFIKEFTSQRITLEGAVAKPGIYPIKGTTTLVQAVAIGGGHGQLASLTDVKVYRVENGERKTYTYDLDKIRSGEVPDPPIQNEDIIVVNRDPGRVAIRDSALGDFIGIFNPFNYLRP